MDIRNDGRGNWCYYAAHTRSGATVAVCGDKEQDHKLLDGELFSGRNVQAIENMAHELNRVRLGMQPKESSEVIARFLAQLAFREKGR